MTVHRPWRIDEDNDTCIVVVDDAENLVHAAVYREIPVKRGSVIYADMVNRERENAYAMVVGVNSMSPALTDIIWDHAPCQKETLPKKRTRA